MILDYTKVFLLSAAFWIPSIMRDFFVIAIIYFLFDNFKQFNSKLTNLENKVSYNI